MYAREGDQASHEHTSHHTRLPFYAPRLGRRHDQLPRDVCEQALPHTLADETEAAYRRSDALAKRRLLMDEWARYCLSKLTGIQINAQ
jgi:hypothetical protein